MPLDVNSFKDDVALQQLVFGVIAASPSWTDAKTNIAEFEKKLRDSVTKVQVPRPGWDPRNGPNPGSYNYMLDLGNGQTVNLGTSYTDVPKRDIISGSLTRAYNDLGRFFGSQPTGSSGERTLDDLKNVYTRSQLGPDANAYISTDDLFTKQSEWIEDEISDQDTGFAGMLSGALKNLISPLTPLMLLGPISSLGAGVVGPTSTVGLVDGGLGVILQSPVLGELGGTLLPGLISRTAGAFPDETDPVDSDTTDGDDTTAPDNTGVDAPTWWETKGYETKEDAVEDGYVKVGPGKWVKEATKPDEENTGRDPVTVVLPPNPDDPDNPDIVIPPDGDPDVADPSIIDELTEFFSSGDFVSNLINTAVSTYTTLNFQNDYQDLADAYLEATKFKPYDVETGAGKAVFDEANQKVTTILDPTFKDDSNRLDAFAKTIGEELTQFDTEGYTQHYLDLLRKRSSDYENQAMNRLFEIQNASGTGATSSGAAQWGEFMKAKNAAELERQITAEDRGFQRRGNLFDLYSGAVSNRWNMENGLVPLMELGANIGGRATSANSAAMFPSFVAGVHNAGQTADMWNTGGQTAGNIFGSIFDRKSPFSTNSSAGVTPYNWQAPPPWLT